MTILTISNAYSFPSILSVSGVNARYFTDATGKVILLVGSHTWDNRQDLGTGAFDWTGYLDDLETWGHNFIRLWIWEEPSPPNGSPNLVQTTTTLTPEVWARSSTPGEADGGNKFDLTQYNSTHFIRLRQRCIDARNRGIYVSIMLFNGWSAAQKGGGADPWPNHPFQNGNNINSIDGDTNNDGNGFETQDLSVSAITALQDAYIEHVIDVVNDLDNVLFEIANEPDGTVTGTYDWCNHMIDYIHTYEAGKPKQHPVWFTIPYPGGDNDELVASNAEAISRNGEITSAGAAIDVYDTDHLYGIGGSAIDAWSVFTRGAGGYAYMDSWDNLFLDCSGLGHPIQNLRDNLGYILAIANLVDLLHTVPQDGGTSPCQTGYCLKPASGSYHQYICFQPNSGNFTLDLTGESGTFDIRKVRLSNGDIDTAQTTTGGASRTITQPTGWTTGWSCWVRPQ